MKVLKNTVGIIILLGCQIGIASSTCQDFTGKYRPANITGASDYYRIWEWNQFGCNGLQVNTFETDPKDQQKYKFNEGYSWKWTFTDSPVLETEKPDFAIINDNQIRLISRTVFSPNNNFVDCVSTFTLDFERNIEQESQCTETHARGTQRHDFSLRVIHYRING